MTPFLSQQLRLGDTEHGGFGRAANELAANANSGIVTRREGWLSG